MKKNSIIILIFLLISNCTNKNDISDVDIKTLNFNWKLDHAPTLNELRKIKLKRNKLRAPLYAKEIIKKKKC